MKDTKIICPQCKNHKIRKTHCLTCNETGFINKSYSRVLKKMEVKYGKESY